MMFKIGDRVKVSRKYPYDMEHPIAHADESEMWGLIGDIIGQDDVFFWVEPFGLFNTWPKKQKFDPLSYWHFTEVELERA